MENLLEHHIAETRQRFKELRSDFKIIEYKIDELHDFKIQTIMSAKMTSMIISAVCGFVTLVATCTVEYFLKKN